MKYFIAGMIIAIVVLVLIPGLNARQISSWYLVQSEKSRLTKSAMVTLPPVALKAAVSDDFNSGLSPKFWDLTIINSARHISHASSFHAAEFKTQGNMLEIVHRNDPDFNIESPDLWNGEQYTDVALFGASGFEPRSATDVVLHIGMKVSADFYGTAGVIFQPVGMISQEGKLEQPPDMVVDMIGVSLVGPESQAPGLSGPFAYLTLNSETAKTEPLSGINEQEWHDYEVRLRWDSIKEWTEIVSVDGVVQAAISMPPFGPVQLKVWSDNYKITYPPRIWWEFSAMPALTYQNGGNKTFYIRNIQVAEETH
jgi:hypothetical protein